MAGEKRSRWLERRDQDGSREDVKMGGVSLIWLERCLGSSHWLSMTDCARLTCCSIHHMSHSRMLMPNNKILSSYHHVLSSLCENRAFYSLHKLHCTVQAISLTIFALTSMECKYGKNKFYKILSSDI